MARMAMMGKARRVLGPVILTILLDDAPREAELGRGRLRKVPSTLMDACRDPRDPPRSRPVVNRALMAAMRRPSKIRRAHVAALAERGRRRAPPPLRQRLPNLPHFEIGLDLAARGRWRTRAWRGGSRLLIADATRSMLACLHSGPGIGAFFREATPSNL